MSDVFLLKRFCNLTEYYDWFKKSGKEHGITANDVAIDFGALKQRKAGIVKGLVDSIAAHFKRHEITWLKGEGHFIDPHTIEINKGKEAQTISADNIIIASGSEPINLPFLTIDENRLSP